MERMLFIIYTPKKISPTRGAKLQYKRIFPYASITLNKLYGCNLSLSGTPFSISIIMLSVSNVKENIVKSLQVIKKVYNVFIIFRITEGFRRFRFRNGELWVKEIRFLRVWEE